MSTRPNALIIGAGKAGSTSLHNYLARHPHAFGSKQKELMYFTANHDKGAEWYLSHFPEQDGVEIYFESTPQYSFRDEFPAVAQRVKDYNPEMKILYIVREPISRIVSHFNHWARVHPDRYTDIEESLRRPGHRRFFVERTRYHYQICAYLDLFPRDRIKVVFLEDLNVRFVETLNDVFGFLGLEPVAEGISNAVYNKRPASEGRVWRADDLSAERKAEIRDYLKPDVQALYDLCGKDRGFWGDGYA